MLISFGIIGFWSCQENEDNVLNSLENNTITSTTNLAPLSVVEAKNWYEAQKRTQPTSFNRNEEMVNAATATPDWNFASIVKYEGTKDMIVVPIHEKIDMFDLPKTSVYNLVIYKISDNQFKSRLLFFVPSAEYARIHPDALSVKDFTGVTFQMDDSSRINSGWVLKNGQFEGAFKTPKFNANGQIQAASRGPLEDLWDKFISWFLGEGCHGHGAWQRFTNWLSNQANNVDFWWDFNFKPRKTNYNGSDGSNFGSFGPGSNFAGIWGTWTNGTGNTGGGGGSGGFKDFFPDGVFGIKNVKKSYADVCSASTTNANTPFLFAMESLRQVATNDSEFENAFARTLDYYYQLKAMGQNVTFVEVMKEYVINPNKGISAPMQLTPQLPTLASNPSFKSKVRSIMQQATSQYSQCVNTYGLQASTNNAPIEIPNDAACSCLGDFSVEDALNDMQSTINGVKIQDLKNRYPTLSSEIDTQTANGKTVEEIEREIIIAQQMVIQSPKKPINDIIDYLKCFKPNPNCTYSVTLAIDQPINGSGSSFNPANPSDVGHTFLIIKQECSDGSSVTRSLGFYPNASVVTPFNPTKPGILGNDENHNYNAQVTIQTNGTALMDLLAIIISSVANNPPHSPIYDLNTHNCTNWAVNVLGAWGTQVPTTGSEWPFSKGKGLNPGKIGEDIKQWNSQPNKSNSTQDSKTPPNSGGC